VEVIVGAKHDDQFGPVIMFGLGGVMVEVMRDVVFRLVPLERQQAAEMVRAIRGYPLLAGARGRTPLDTAALEKLLVVCSEVMEAYPQIAEMDLNPVLVQEKGVAVLDARVILAS
jgi:acyl-CoA synthetase (NDP forming)